ncbi:MAG: site-specific DNA-methyltransferase, partial [Candidatus Methylomirabilales bacterium]
AAAELRHMSRPFLNWSGKVERREFTVPTLPLFIHERLSTQAILQSVKSRKRDRQQALALFADEELDVADRLLKAYQHQTDWVNRLILGDSLVVMNSLLQYEGLGGQVQMIYMDPPYGVRFGSNFQPFIRRRDVKHGDDSDLTREPEMVQAYRDTWELGLHSYLAYLRDRLVLCRELLHPSGSLFLQISDENVHHARELMDEVFGSQNFCGLINFKSMSALSQEGLAQVYDYLIWYARDKQRTKFRPLFVSQDVSEDKEFRFIDYPQSVAGYRRLSDEEFAALDRHDLSKVFRRSVLTSSGFTPSCTFEFEYHGIICRPFGKKSWRTTREGVQQLIEQNRLFILGDSPYFKQYYSDFPYMQLDNSWSDTAYASGRIYVVQTSPKVVQRCVLMTTDPGDLVLDPTCGSGTTAYVAEQWGRRWITIDTSRVPLALARQRLLTATFAYYELRDPVRGPAGGFVYKRKKNQKGEEVGGIVPHITLRSIAQNEPTQEEVLVDRPEVESGVVRVSGPFVVEATIPTAIEVEPVRVAMEGEAAYEADPIGRMIEVLRRSPTLRLAGNQTVTLKNIRRPAKAMDLHAEAELAELTLEDLAEEAAKQKSLDMKRGKPVAFIFGPEHGPVTEQMVFSAAKEAYLKNYTHLFVIGFAIQPGASKLIQSCEQAVGLPATYVQATMDLLMQDLLKTTRASQVFSVTGSPDVRLIRLKRKNGNGPLYQVELLGLDVFDPVTMQTTHHKGDDLPAWFLDTDYDDLVFHVSQAFFPRTSAWDNLKRSLKGVYEESVWEHLAGTVSEPFSAGEYRKIAVKVIDDRGNELMVVKALDEAVRER